MEPILWPDIMKPFAMRILRRCGAGLSSKNKDESGVMWLQQEESISQAVGDRPYKAEREDE